MNNKNQNCAVYGIYGLNSSKIYIGGTTRLNIRITKEHVSQLKKNKHKNEELQKDWNDYGEDNFIFLLIEFTIPETLKERENSYIKACKKTGNAYNIKGGPSGPLFVSDETKKKMSDAKKGANHPNYGKPCYEGAGRKPKTYKFISPEGVEVQTTGLNSICEQYDLSASSMSRLANGKLEHHKGWRRVECII